jgi:hypothetical protein
LIGNYLRVRLDPGPAVEKKIEKRKFTEWTAEILSNRLMRAHRMSVQKLDIGSRKQTLNEFLSRTSEIVPGIFRKVWDITGHFHPKRGHKWVFGHTNYPFYVTILEG